MDPSHRSGPGKGPASQSADSAVPFRARLATSGGALLRPAVAYLLAVWATHAVLRMALLFRKDAYGFPFVGKVDWYIFYAFAIDWLWILTYSAPALLLLLVLGAIGRRRAGRVVFGFLAGFHSLVLLFTVADQETMRFLGMHLDLSLWTTYGNPASLREVLGYLSSDRSVPYLPYVLLVGCVPLSFLLFHLTRRFAWAGRGRLGATLPAVLVGTAAICHIFLDYVWTGGFRMLKLKPFPATLAESLGRRKAPGAVPSDLAALGARVQAQWIREQGDSTWVFPDPARPLLKVPVEHLCATEPSPRCQEDRDGDGHSASADCDDADPRVHPGGKDLPGNGLDEDCDGLDFRPRNFVVIFLESHRAVNVGYLGPFGAKAGATPVLDSLASRGHAWTRFSCSGLPTINALLSSHMSILQHPTRYISSDFTTLNHRAFPEVLRDRGYRTRFFSAADPTWDGQVPWLRKWYGDIDYDRGRERDESMFLHMAAWMRDSLANDRPFLIGAITKTNHYPFNPEPGVRELPRDASLEDRMKATMEYTDAGLGRFFDAIRGEPWFPHTLFIILADHGFPLSEHGSSTIGHGLYNESTWIPFVVYGEHPELGPPALHDYPASQVDLGPTVLDLAGVREPNHSLGHSLVRRATGLHSTSFLVRGQQGTLEHGEYRIHGPLGDIPREQGPEVFNSSVDRLETRNLLPGAQAVHDSLMPILLDLGLLNTYLIETDAFWPDSASSSAWNPVPPSRRKVPVEAFTQIDAGGL
ncbi:MAG TPA: sulfatase-like hydrolase/transferase [Fibrobacteria bacterium]|nr:sulfatase-like hydrolase/transferase [Fibrobacteria bacterium]